METLDLIFCTIMNGIYLTVGPACSGARTFLECMFVAFVCCVLDRTFTLRLFVVAAIAAIFANAIRCIVLLTWKRYDWPNYDMVHDLGGMAIVVIAFLVIILTPQKKRSK